MANSGEKNSGPETQTAGSTPGKRSLIGVFPQADNLQDERELLNSVVSSLHETLIIGFDRKGSYVFVWGDPVLTKRYGVDISSFAGKTLFDVFPAEAAARRVEEIRQVYDNGKCFREEYAVDFPGGRFWHDASISPLRNEKGKMLACLGIIQDITRSKRAEHSLNESEQRYRSVVDQSADFIVMHSAGKILFANQAAVRAAGMESSTEMIGRSVLDLMHPDSHALARKRMTLAKDQPEVLPPIEEKFIGREGKVFYGEAISQRVTFEGQAVILTTVRDITARRKAERESRAWQERIQETQKQESLAVLAGGVAHDFNNLLMGIMGNANIMLSEITADSPWYQRLCTIEQASQRASELTRQLVAYSGGAKFVLQPINLADLCHEMRGLLRASISRKIEFRFDIDPELPAVPADATQMRQVIMNLFLNAAEAIGEGTGSINVRIRAQDADRDLLAATFMQSTLAEGPCVSMVISDDGCGMAPDTRAKMFDPFFSTKGAGRGLGLAAVMGIVHGHGGAMLVDSETGAGTKFELLFPLAEASLVEEVHATSTTQQPANWHPEGLYLLADDEKHVREVMLETLVGPKTNVLAARDGQEAVDLFKQSPNEFKAAILDVTMPRLSGSEAMERLRKLRPDLPVVLTSGYADMADTKLAGNGAHSVFLAKPFRPSELIKALYEVLS